MERREKQMRTKLISMTLALVLLCGAVLGLSGRALASVASETGMDEIAEQSGEQGDCFAPEQSDRLNAPVSAPSCFDLRNVPENGAGKNYVTSVKVQNPYGSCWGFGAISAAETSIIGSGLADADTLDLSEKQIAWFNANALNDPNHPQNGEGMMFGKGVTPQDRYDIGGITSFATNLYASGIGPTREDTATEDGEIYRYRGRQGLVNHDRVSWYDASGEEHQDYRPVSYSEDDDWTMPERYRFHQDYRLKESFILPSPADIEEDSQWGAAINAIKDQLLQKRAVAIHYASATYLPGQETRFSDVIGENWAQYDNDWMPPSHVVTIVGYDDNYPKTNFVKTPPEDGAWLVKNSWGSDLNEFPNNGFRHFGLLEGQDGIPYDGNARAKSNLHTGYFWLSYYDRTVKDPEAYSFEPLDREYSIDQHDVMPVSEYEAYSTGTENRMANVFTASKARKLTDISFFTATPGTTVSYQVYLLPDNAVNPEDGVLAVSFSSPKRYPYGGYHRETLREEDQIVLPKGQKYSVVVTEQTPSGKYSISFAESDSEENEPGNRWFTSVVNKGESYLYLDGKWNDLSSRKIRKLLAYDGWGKCVDNFSIKAYSVPADTNGAYLDVKKPGGYTISSLDLTLKSSQKLTAAIRGGTGELTVQPVIRWELSDPDLLTLEETDSGTQATVTPVKSGHGHLIVDAGIYGRRILDVTVHKLGLRSAVLSDASAKQVYTGKALKPEPESVSAETMIDYQQTTDLKKGRDYRLSYENNVKCGKGEVIVTGIGKYEGELRTDFFTQLSFLILPARARIQTVTPGDRSLTVTFRSQEESGIDGYALSYREKGTKKWTTKKLGARDTSAVISALAAGTSYEIKLKAFVTIVEKDVFNEDTMEYEDIATDYYGEASDAAVSKTRSDTAPSEEQGDAPTVKELEQEIAALRASGNLKDSTFRTLRLTSDQVTAKRIRLSWKKLSKADGYILYGVRCGQTKYRRLKDLSGGKTAWTCKGAKKGTYYKFLLVAYQTQKGTKRVLASSKVIHVATSGGWVGNYRSVKVKPAKAQLKKGRRLVLKATPIRADKRRKVNRHQGIAFESSDTKIATVNKKGQLTAKNKGSCTVFVYAQNGCCAKVKVTVR